MKKIFALCGGVLMLLPTLGTAETLTVQKKAQLRSAPSFTSKIITSAPYNSTVEVIEEQDGWKRVIYRGREGWMQDTSFMTTEGKINAGVKILEGAVSSKEVSLAGKGFDPETEKEYKKSHREANYAAVDKMEKSNKIAFAELKKFKSEGDFSNASKVMP